MKRRDLLRLVVTALGLLGIGLVTIPFLRSLSPSSSAKANASLVVQLSELQRGVLKVVENPYKPLFILRPSAEQLRAIESLDGHVWNTAQISYANEADVFIYWGISTRFGCALQEKKASRSILLEFSDDGTWLGGYWDPACQVSYDYAGRAIKSHRFSYNGYVAEVPNLEAPRFRRVDNKLIVTLW
ncbi:MAG: hypothetical protein EYC71_06465 [Gammaproteobacteria bacterium]|nr:MAG: hypothetical protein EYC71_06465 [Gammaproteobacteria bacterium]